MKRLNTIDKLRMISYTGFAILMVAAAFVAFRENYVMGIIVMILSFWFEWRYYRCPHCETPLDIRMKLNERTYCPECGKVISQTDSHQKGNE